MTEIETDVTKWIDSHVKCKLSDSDKKYLYEEALYWIGQNPRNRTEPQFTTMMDGLMIQLNERQ